MVDQAVVPHLSCLANDDAHAVVDDQPASDLRPRVDLNPRPEPAPLGDGPGQKFHLVTVTEMGRLMVKGGMDPGVKKEDLQFTPGRRVSGLIGRQGFTQMGHFRSPHKKFQQIP